MVSYNKGKIIKPRDYQVEAMEAFKENNWNGILEMATGTGKTITSLLVAKDYKEKVDRIFLIIFVPYVHLVNQWEENCNKLGFYNVLNCTGAKSTWVNKLWQRIRDFNIGVSKVETIITTYRSAASKVFNENVSKIKKHSFLIADECHYFGIRSLKKHKLHNLGCKMGLSATPDRWWDLEGTKTLREFFGGTVYKYDLEKAIISGALTEYKYNPIVVDLNYSELSDYERLTKRLMFLLNDQNKDKEEIEKINRQRSMIISKASMKRKLLYKSLKKKLINDIFHTLVYCAPGEIDAITKDLSNMGVRAHRFDHTIGVNKRAKILEAFSKGNIQVLIAIKCLDEGVDVPSTKRAYFLASTSNPREFIQRRGRILRKYKGKNIAEIYDFIVLPLQASKKVFKTIASKELPRFAEFSRFAINSFTCREEIGYILEKYNLEYLMDKLPWEVFHENREKWEGFYDYKC